MEFEELDATPVVVQPDKTDEGQQPDNGGQESPDPAQSQEQAQEQEPPAQSQEDNAKFADMRRKQELDATRGKLASTQAEIERLEKALGGLGYFGNAIDIADTLEAQNRNVTAEQVRCEREEENRRLRELEVRHKADIAMMDDLHQVQRVNPAVRSVEELGDEFTALRFAVDGLGRPLHTAESAYLELQKRKAPPKTHANDKDHLIVTGGAASTSKLVDIPASELDIYQEAFPNDTPAKLKERYNRVRERQGE